MPSSVIHSFAYDPARAVLDVTFFNGRRYRYFMVPAYVAEGLGDAFSMGRFFNTRIRERYPVEELEQIAKVTPQRAISPETGSQRHP